MTWKDKLELRLKEDAPFRRDNLPADEVQGPEETSGPGRSPVVTEFAMIARRSASRQWLIEQRDSVNEDPQRSDAENERTDT